MSWLHGTTYVVGHQRPDSDAIGSAMGYAWFLQAGGHEETAAARCGNPGSETRFALDYYGMEPPPYLGSVWSTFGHAARPVPPVPASTSLGEAMARMAGGDRALPVIDPAGRALGAITAIGLARAFIEGGECRERAAALVMDQVPMFLAEDRIRDSRSSFVRSDFDDFLVVDANQQYLGLAPRHRLLEPPRARLILVDHNELAQAVPGAEEAEIVGVLDHHKLGNPPTETPIRFIVEAIGCTCTLVTERCRALGLIPPRGMLGMLLTGILSDTLVFRSPTTTHRDRSAGAWLGEQLQLEVEPYGLEMLGHSPGLAAPVEELVDGDRKAFRIGSVALSLGQAEVTSLNDLPSHREALLAALHERLQKESLAFIGLMVTDVVEARSQLLWCGEKRIAMALPFSRVAEGQMDLVDMVSRKKQLLPALYAALERC